MAVDSQRLSQTLVCLRDEIRTLRHDFATWDSSDLRLAFVVSTDDADPRILMSHIGKPIGDIFDDGPIVTSVDATELSKCTAGYALMERAGKLAHHAMDFLPETSYAAWIKRHGNTHAFVAFLACGIRSLHVQSKSGGRHWLDDPGPRCVEALDWLLARLPLSCPTSTKFKENSAKAASDLELVVNVDSYEIQIAGDSCKFGDTKPFWLFAEIHAANGEYVAVQTLIDRVWGDSLTDSETVQQTATRLRRKLKGHPFNRLEIDGQSKPGYYRLIVR